MKRLFFAILVALLPMSLMASPDADQVKPAVSKEDAAAVRKSVAELGQLFGVESSDQKTDDKDSKKDMSEHKTVADVMDKAVDKISDVVGVLGDTLKKVAPDVWEVMIRQQYAKAIADPIPWTGFTVILWILSRAFKKWRQKKIDASETRDRDTEYSAACFFYYSSLILTAGSAVVVANYLATSIQLLVNPKYYAIQDLLRMILQRG